MFDKLLTNARHSGCIINCLRCFNLAAFVPKNEPCSEKDISDLLSFLSNSKRIFVLTGAGISTESGIPDYRSEGVGLYARSSNRPVQMQQFMANEDVRRRYWARNYVGWPRFSSISPNITHQVLSKWENYLNNFTPSIDCIVTQNVDRLHHKAGSKSVIELHGTAFKVICMSCNTATDRHQLQQRMEKDNSSLMEIMSPTQMIRPDGDVDIPAEFISIFKTPKCLDCGGILKPDIVFFGDNVPRAKVDHVYKRLSLCDTVFVLGSSLQVFSGYRFALEAKEKQKRIAIINIGHSRADHLADFKLSRKCGEIFRFLEKLYLT